MAGLLSKQTTPQAGAGQPGMPTVGDDTEGASNVMPEEQAEYDTFVTNGMKMLYSEKSLPQIVESIKGDGNPVEGLANTLAMVVMRLEDSAADSGKEISGDVKMQGAIELMEQMVELAETAGVHQFGEDEMESALFQALDIYRDIRKDRLPVDEIKQDFAELQQAEAQGTLDQLVPGASEFAAKHAQRA